MSKKREVTSQREVLKQKRLKEKKRNRYLIIGIISLVAIVAAILLIAPSLKPAQTVATAEPNPRPRAQGLTMGDPNAPVKVVEFSDFQCPYCKQFAEQSEQNIVINYVIPGRIQVEFKSFAFLDDFSSGRESKNAAEAAYCASDQNKFWEYHDILFANQEGENQGAFTKDRLMAFGEKIGLDMTLFRSCYDSGKYRQQVTDDREFGSSKGVNSTPSFTVNGKLVKMEKADSLTSAIDQELIALGLGPK